MPSLKGLFEPLAEGAASASSMAMMSQPAAVPGPGKDQQIRMANPGP